jgi:hypothetical protein
MKLFKSFAIYVMFFAAISFFACGGGGGDSSVGDVGTGTVSVNLTDSTTDEYLAVYVTVADVQICGNDTEDSSDDCNWKSLETENDEPLQNRTYNLLKLVNGVTEAIGSNDFSEGIYHQIRLIIGDTPELENNLLGVPHDFANYLILNDGSNTIEQLKIPSGFQTGIKLVHQFEVLGEETKELVLDFDAGRSVVKAGNSGKYILKPTIRVFETAGKIDVYGEVTDDSDTPEEIGNATVSAQISDGLSTTVIRSTITDGVGTENNLLEEGEYLLSLLSPDQIYNIVVYRGHVEGEAHIYSPECMVFRYNDAPELEPELDFTLSTDNAGVGTISGQVTVGGGVDSDFAFTVTVYTDLDCGRADGEGYVEITKADIGDYLGGGIFEYSVKLPIYDTPVKYYVVASADGYIPDKDETTLSSSGLADTEVDLEIVPAE